MIWARRDSDQIPVHNMVNSAGTPSGCISSQKQIEGRNEKDSQTEQSKLCTAYIGIEYHRYKVHTDTTNSPSMRKSDTNCNHQYKIRMTDAMYQFHHFTVSPKMENQNTWYTTRQHVRRLPTPFPAYWCWPNQLSIGSYRIQRHKINQNITIHSASTQITWFNSKSYLKI